MHPSEDIKGVKSTLLDGRKVVVGVTGSIAATECAKFVRELIRHGAEVHCVMSPSAAGILHPQALEYASGHRVITEITGMVEHVALCGEVPDRADLYVVYPCTGNTLSKIACGIDDTTVTTFAATALGSGIPVLLVPAMHGSMYRNPFVVENMERLEEKGVHVMRPVVAERAAKAPDHSDVVVHILRLLGPGALRGRRVSVFTGATQEPMDDMRVVTNRSTGRTGLEIARWAYIFGADVEVWHPESMEVPGYMRSHTFTDVASVISRLPEADIALVPAAFSDFTPAERKKGKIPSSEPPLLRLKRAPKVLPELRKRSRFLVGFKACSGLPIKEMLAQARDLMRSASLDMVVANDLRRVSRDRTEVHILCGRRHVKASGTKSEVARRIVEEVASCL